MTEAEARQWARDLLYSGMFDDLGSPSDDQIGFVAGRVLAAVEEEREACAKVAEAARPVSREEAPKHWASYEKEWWLRQFVADEIAAAIRGRSQT